MAIDRPQAIDDALGTSRSTAEDGGGAAFFPHEEWRMRQRKKVARPIAAEAIEASAVLRPDQAIKKCVGV